VHAKNDIEQRPACVRVDFDELRTFGIEMKVITYEHTTRARIEPRNLGAVSKYERPVGRQTDDRLHRRNDVCHLRYAAARHEHR
jgi:hypothetical protein